MRHPRAGLVSHVAPLYHLRPFRTPVRVVQGEFMASARSLDAALQTGAQVIAQAKRVQVMLRGSPTPAPQGQDTRFVPPPIAIPAGSACVAPGTAFTSVSGTVRPLLPGVVVNGDTKFE